jgi:hypothetical protein
MSRLPLVALVALGLCGSPLSADVIRESTGQRRVDLDKMELKAFPADAWGKLAAWSGGDALTAGSTAGKPVLIMTWASWHPASLKNLGLAQKMADKFGAQGLIVVGVHGPQGWNEAPKAAQDRGAKFLLAHDATGDFRKTLLVDHDPQYYVLDRAGHLRYAAVSSASVEEACAEVVTETTEQASNLPKLLKDRADQATAAAGKTRAIRTDVGLSTLPPLPPGYSQPVEAVYKISEWPKMDEQRGRDFGLLDTNGKRVEPRLNFAPQGYYPSKPEVQGRAQVIYFWHPDVVASYDKSMTQMDLLQQQYPRDLVVIGSVLVANKLDAQRNTNDPNKQEDVEKLLKRYQAFVGSRNFRHTFAADFQGTSWGSIGQSGSNKIPIPGAMVVSSDGVIRWVGFSNGPDFRYAVDTVLANDPGIRARRELDQKYIETNGK